MPEPGKTPQPAFEGLPYGQNKAANDFATDADVDAELFGDPEDDYSPTPDEQMLFGPTDRPDEPITAGVGFGDGPDATRHTFESDGDVLASISRRILADPTADPQAKAFANRKLAGL